MKIFDELDPLDPHGSVVTVGVYDGVHLGHQHTLRQVIADAASHGRRSVVATFDRHPAEVLRPESAPLMLCNLEQRLELVESLGIDVAAVIPFNKERSGESAETFIEEILVGQLGAGKIIVGDNFRFGHDRKGDVALLRREGERLGFDVEGVELDARDGDIVSSTRIRTLIRDGQVGAAADLLGRVHEVCGVVARGDGRGGTELGYPTANLLTQDGLAIPGVGIYAGWYRDEKIGSVPAAISVGRRPTFYDKAEPLIEAHLLDFDGDLYERTARVSFLDFLRDEERFDGVDALKAQMGLDVEGARDLCRSRSDLAPNKG